MTKILNPELGKGTALGVTGVLTINTDLTREWVDATSVGGSSGISELTGEVTAGPGSGSQAATINPAGTPEVARLGLGVAADASAVLKMAGQYYSPEVTDTAAAGAATIDWDDGTEHYLQLNAAPVALTFSNPKAGGRYVLLLQQDSGGSKTVTWPGTILWPGNVAPTLTTAADKTDLFTFLYSGALGKYIGNYALNF